MLLELIRNWKNKRRQNMVSQSTVQVTLTPNLPLCQVFGDILEDRVFSTLGIDKEEYHPVFSKLRDYWGQKLGKHGFKYVLCSARQLVRVLHTPQEWLEVGRYLADATSQTYFNGSHEFIEHAIPALIDSGVATTRQELESGIDILLYTINPYGRGEHLYSDVAKLMHEGKIKTLGDIRRLKVVDQRISYGAQN